MKLGMEFESLYKEYAKVVYRYIFLMCKDQELAEDITQTVFLKAIQKSEQFTGKSKLSTWLCAIAKNEYLNYCRKYNRQQSYEEYIEKNGDLEKEADDCRPDIYLEKIIREEDVNSIFEVLKGFSKVYQEVFTLRIYGELDFEEIGKLFEKNATWARVTYYRAKNKLKERLQNKEGFDEV